MLLVNNCKDYVINNFIINILVRCINYIIYMYYYLTNNCNYLLEFPSKYKFGKEKIHDIDINNKLVVAVRKFMEKNNLYENGIIVSLSGGVDSMVILAILIRLTQEQKFNIYTCSINYNLREESFDEMEFLRMYCDTYNIQTFCHHLAGTFNKGVGKRGIKNSNISGGRQVFEETSREIRYNSYKEIIKEYKCNGVMVGHHKDDIIENIFTNSLKGRDIMNIEVMKKNSNINNVDIYRPLLEFPKSDIYELAHNYNIPYFLDTTPEWSRRGKMRNEIFPLFDNVFGKSWKKKYKEIGTQSNDWNRTIDKYFVKSWLDNVFYVDQGFTFQPKYMEDKNLWIYIIPKMFFKMNASTIKRRSIIRMYDNIYNNHHINKNINLDSGFKYIFDGNKITIFKN